MFWLLFPCMLDMIKNIWLFLVFLMFPKCNYTQISWVLSPFSWNPFLVSQLFLKDLPYILLCNTESGTYLAERLQNCIIINRETLSLNWYSENGLDTDSILWLNTVHGVKSVKLSNIAMLLVPLNIPRNGS